MSRNGVVQSAAEVPVVFLFGMYTVVYSWSGVHNVKQRKVTVRCGDQHVSSAGTLRFRAHMHTRHLAVGAPVLSVANASADIYHSKTSCPATNPENRFVHTISSVFETLSLSRADSGLLYR